MHLIYFVQIYPYFSRKSSPIPHNHFSLPTSCVLFVIPKSIWCCQLTHLLLAPIRCQLLLSKGMGFHESLPYPSWESDCLDFMQALCIQPQLLGVNACNGTVLSDMYYFAANITTPRFWSPLPSSMISEPLGKECVIQVSHVELIHQILQI